MSARKPRSLLRAIELHADDASARLKVLREIVAERIDGTDSARETASLGRLMLDVEAALRGLQAGSQGSSPVDDLLARRAARGAS